MKKNPECIARLMAAGVKESDAWTLRRIAMTLHRWHELECGDGNGYIERDEKTGKPYYVNCNSRYLSANDPRNRRVIADRETGARRRLDSVMQRYAGLTAYIQSDPRGAALWILREGDLPAGADVESYYSRGIAVYK
jgi:hypothetical protein